MLVLAGKNNIAVNALLYVWENYDGEIAIVGNRTDHGIHGWQRSFKKTAKALGVKEISLEDAYKKASVFISLEFDRIVDPEKFATDRLYNIHFSLLPKYKGMYTSIWPLLNNEDYSGVTLHRIDKGIDTGEIINQIKFEISCRDRAQDLYRKYLFAGYELFVNNFKNLIEDNINSKPQVKENSTYYSNKSICFKGLEIDLNQTAFSILRQIYSFSFRVYQLPKIKNRIIAEAEILDECTKEKPGTILSESELFFDLSTIDYDIRLFFSEINNIEKFSNCKVCEVESLLANLCGVHDRNEKGWSPIIVAAYHGNIEVVKKLLAIGADVNDFNNNGTTVLMYAKDFAIRSKNKKLFHFLLNTGADLSKKDFNGKKLLDYLSDEESRFLGLDK